MKDGATTSGRPMGNHLMAAALLYKKKQKLGQIVGQGMPRGINRLRKATMKMSGTIKLGLSMKKQREAGVGTLIRVDDNIIIKDAHVQDPRIIAFEIKIYGFNIQLVTKCICSNRKAR